jgi:hypothetical protein
LEDDLLKNATASPPKKPTIAFVSPPAATNAKTHHLSHLSEPSPSSNLHHHNNNNINMNKTKSLSVLSNRARTLAFNTKKNRRNSQDENSERALIERSQRKLSIHSSMSGFLDDDPSFQELAIPLPGPGHKKYERRGATTQFSLDKISPAPAPEDKSEVIKKANRRHERRGSVTKYSLDAASSSPENSEELQAPTSSFPSMPSDSQPTIDQLPLPMRKSSKSKNVEKKSGEKKTSEKKKKRKSSSSKTKTSEENEQPPEKPPRGPGRNQRRNSVTEYSESIIASPPGTISSRKKSSHAEKKEPAQHAPTLGRNQRRNSVTKYSDSMISSPSVTTLPKVRE